MNLNIQSINQENPFKICFVCLGNICRSPTAEGIFECQVNERSLQPWFEIDSAGTSAYHIGEPANSNSRQMAQQYGITLHSKARRFESSDLDYFDLILAMDRDNLQNILSLVSDKSQTQKIMLMRDFDPASSGDEVPDPYAGGIDGFKNVFLILERSCHHLLNLLEKKIEDA